MWKQFIMLCLCTVTLASCSSTSNEPGKLNVDPNQKDIEVTETSESTSESQASPQETNETKETEKKEVTIDDSIKNITKSVSRLTHFKNGTPDEFESIVKELNSYNVTMKNGVTMKQPFELYPIDADGNQDSVIASYTSKQAFTKEGSHYIIDIVARHAVSPTNGMDPNKVGRNLIEYLKDDEYKRLDRKVQYKLEVSDDRKSATLEVVTPDVW